MGTELSALPDYINPRTGITWPVNTPRWCAEDDGGYVNLIPGEGLVPSDINQNVTSLWRYAKAIRLPKMTYSSMGEGWTPLVPSTWHGREILMKMDFLMPSGSYKDRGVAVMSQTNLCYRNSRRFVW